MSLDASAHRQRNKMCEIRSVYSITSVIARDSQSSSPSQGKTIILVCKLPVYGQPEAKPSQNSSSDGFDRASEYLTQHHASSSVNGSSLETFTYAACDPLPYDTDAVVFIFDPPFEVLLKFVHEPPSKREFRDGFALSKFLNNDIWDHVASIRQTNLQSQILLSSGSTCVPLSDFSTAIVRLVEDGEVTACVSALGDIGRTGFCRVLTPSEAPSRPHEELDRNYTYQNIPLSDLNLQQLLPGNVSGPHGSETSESAEEGSHEN